MAIFVQYPIYCFYVKAVLPDGLDQFKLRNIKEKLYTDNSEYSINM